MTFNSVTPGFLPCWRVQNSISQYEVGLLHYFDTFTASVSIHDQTLWRHRSKGLKLFPIRSPTSTHALYPLCRVKAVTVIHFWSCLCVLQSHCSVVLFLSCLLDHPHPNVAHGGKLPVHSSVSLLICLSVCLAGCLVIWYQTSSNESVCLSLLPCFSVHLSVCLSISFPRLLLPVCMRFSLNSIVRRSRTVGMEVNFFCARLGKWIVQCVTGC